MPRRRHRSLEPIRERPRKPAKLTGAQEVTIATLTGHNVPVEDIARQLGLTERRVKLVAGAAKRVLTAASGLAVRDWIRASEAASYEGRHQAAKELLEAAGVIRPQSVVAAEAARQGAIPAPVTVQVGFHLPGLPRPEPKVIEGEVKVE